MKPEFKTSLQMSTRCINQAAVLRAAGHYVEVVRQPGSRRCIFYADDTVETRMLIDDYERREILPVAVKSVIHERNELFHLAGMVAGGGL